jgi:hypothetical protein
MLKIAISKALFYKKPHGGGGAKNSQKMQKMPKYA